MIDIIKNSVNPVDRQLYVEKMKEYVKHSEEMVEKEMQYILKLKMKISEYDIYNQKNPYQNDTITITNLASDSTRTFRAGAIETGTEFGKSETVEANGGAVGDADNSQINLSDIPFL